MLVDKIDRKKPLIAMGLVATGLSALSMGPWQLWLGYQWRERLLIGYLIAGTLRVGVVSS
jgi:hypothetical protein